MAPSSHMEFFDALSATAAAETLHFATLATSSANSSVSSSSSVASRSLALEPGDECPVELNMGEAHLSPWIFWFGKLLVLTPIVLGLFGNAIVYKIMKHPGFTHKTFRCALHRTCPVFHLILIAPMSFLPLAADLIDNAGSGWLCCRFRCIECIFS